MVKRASALAASVLVLASACGSARHAPISAPVAERLAAKSDSVAAKLQAGDGCGAAALARDLRNDIAAAGLPAAAQAAAAGLAAEIVCVQPAPQAPVVTQPSQDEQGPGKGHGKGKGHEKHKPDKGGD
jgi:hypothetical protein